MTFMSWIRAIKVSADFRFTIRASNEIPHSHTTNGTMNIFSNLAFILGRIEKGGGCLYHITIAGFPKPTTMHEQQMYIQL